MGGCFDLRGNTLIISNKATIPEAFGTTLAHYPSSHSARFKTVIECAFYSNKLMLCRGIASPSFFFFQSVSSSDEVTAKANCRDLNECFSLKKFEAPLPKNTSTQKTSKVTQIVIQAKNPLQRFFFFWADMRCLRSKSKSVISPQNAIWSLPMSAVLQCHLVVMSRSPSNPGGQVTRWLMNK